MKDAYRPPTIKETIRTLWLCLAIVIPLGGFCRLMIETDGFSASGRARFSQKVFGSPTSAATLAAR